MRGAWLGERAVMLAGDGEVQGERRLAARAEAGAATAALSALLQGERDVPLWIAVGSRSGAGQLGETLREARAAGAVVQGFADASVAAVAWLALPGQTLVLDFGQVRTVFSLVSAEGGEARLRRTAVVEMGEATLAEGWLRLFAESMVRQTRYDPLHDPRREAPLREQLFEAALEAERAGSARLALDADGRRHELALSRDQFVTAATATWRPLAEMLQALCAGAGDCQVLVPEALVRLPGAREALAVAGTRTVWSQPDAVAARAASLLPPGLRPGTGVPHLTQLPVSDSPPQGVITHAETRGQEAPPATHFVYRGRAIPILDTGNVLGRDPGEGEGTLELPEGIAGLSRRHCTLLRAGGETILVDHSRFGSFVDGQRVNGRTLLQAGSLLRLGSPGIEVPLIRIG